ncbi:MAG: hypothetical protein A2Z29_10325 [Chloroflexi bacterium RBG_16_56_11]|nr:MAG: hypothetical protein A2Z29_10325 [Chloroflexi bacterium RBG_16_56_11]
MSEFGYAGEILSVDLSDGHVAAMPTSDYAGRFLGGRGIAARLYWELVPAGAGVFDPENCLVCASGPAAGFPGFAGGRWVICGKSAAGEREAFSYANLGDRWGIRLKYAGYNALAVRGKADRPVYLLIKNGKMEIKDATALWGRTSFDAADILKSEHGKGAAVLTIGPAAENLVSFATVLADGGASGSGGLGSVMGSKRLKAIVVDGAGKPRAADPERLSRLARTVSELVRGTAPALDWIIPGLTRNQACYGCGIGCTRQSYADGSGRRYKSFCQATDAYRRPAEKYYGKWSDVVLMAVRLFDGYGLDTAVMQAMIEWLIRCCKEGVITEEMTGLPLAKIGSAEFIETLVKMISYREGFGDLLARGTIKASRSVGKRAEELISYSTMTSANEAKDYDPRLILHNALLLATEPRRPIQQLHEASTAFIGWLAWHNGQEGAFLSDKVFRTIAETFWGGPAAADFSTYDGKALAAKKIQDRTYAKESLVLCDLYWPVLCSAHTADHVGNPTLESQVLSAITGKEIEAAELDRIGERVFNLQRAIMVRQGWGGRSGDRLLDFLHDEPLQYLRFDRDCIVLGRDGQIASRKGAVVDRVEFEKMKDEYYRLRGWDVGTGLQTEARLAWLQLEDVSRDLAGRGLLK